MGYGKSSLLCMVLALSLCSTMINALGITAILSKYPEYAQFSKSLTETKLAEEISSLNVVTVLALNNDAMATLAGKPLDVVKSILSNHIETGFYDERALMDMQATKVPMETILKNKVFVSFINEGEFVFGPAPAGPGVTFDVFLVRNPEAQPGTLSVLQVSKPIILTPAAAGLKFGPSKVVADGATGGEVIAMAPVDAAPAPAPISASSRVVLGFFAAVSAFASLLVFA